MPCSVRIILVEIFGGQSFDCMLMYRQSFFAFGFLHLGDFLVFNFRILLGFLCQSFAKRVDFQGSEEATFYMHSFFRDFNSFMTFYIGDNGLILLI